MSFFLRNQYHIECILYNCRSSCATRSFASLSSLIIQSDLLSLLEAEEIAILSRLRLRRVRFRQTPTREKEIRKILKQTDKNRNNNDKMSISEYFAFRDGLRKTWVVHRLEELTNEQLDNEKRSLINK